MGNENEENLFSIRSSPEIANGNGKCEEKTRPLFPPFSLSLVLQPFLSFALGKTVAKMWKIVHGYCGRLRVCGRIQLDINTTDMVEFHCCTRYAM